MRNSNQIKKIGIITPPGFNQKTLRGIPFRQAYEIAKRFNEKGIETIIFTTNSKDDIIDNIPIKNLKETKLRKLEQKTISTIMSYSPDVIYWFSNPYSGIYMKKNKLNVPIILYISNSPLLFNEVLKIGIKEMVKRKNFIQLFSSIFTMIISKLNHSNITGIITASEAIKQRLIMFGVDEKKIKSAPLCFEFNSKLDFEEKIIKENIVCYSGPLIESRGYLIILKAIKILYEKGNSIKLLFLLRSNQKNEKEKLNKIVKSLGIDNIVEIITEVLEWKEFTFQIKRAKIVCIPQKFVQYEPPMTILEAMYIGKPVISTNAYGIHEMVGENVMISGLGENEVAEKISELLENPELMKKLSKKGYNFASSLKDWNYLSEWTFDSLNDFMSMYNTKNK